MVSISHCLVNFTWIPGDIRRWSLPTVLMHAVRGVYARYKRLIQTDPCESDGPVKNKVVAGLSCIRSHKSKRSQQNSRLIRSQRMQQMENAPLEAEWCKRLHLKQRPRSAFVPRKYLAGNVSRPRTKPLKEVVRTRGYNLPGFKQRPRTASSGRGWDSRFLGGLGFMVFWVEGL